MPHDAASASPSVVLASCTRMLADLEPDAPVEDPFAHRAPPRGLRELIGDAIGRSWAPVVAAMSHARHARMFHPEGLTFAGHIVPLDPGDPGGELDALAQQFDGRVLARCSAALWRGNRRHLDVLGFALRVRRGEGPALDELAHAGDQDLLFATIGSPFTMLLSPLFTDATDFVRNRYWAVSPFAVRGARYQLRLSPIDPPPRPPRSEPRGARLLAAVSTRRAAWALEVRATWTRRWHPIARIDLERHLIIDQAALQFDPFRAGLGLQPIGVVHAIRRAVYAASRAGRPH
jgi:hypothetical protein